jgi:choline dehydrogenase-like flavoprotein
MRSVRRPGAWSAGELATLARLADTFVGPDDSAALADTFVGHDGSARLARLAAERFDRGLDPGQVRRLRLALRLMELPLLGLVFGGSWRPFSRLDQAAREREMRRWATSRLASRRGGYQAFKRILAFLAYADPAPFGGSGPNPRLVQIGYQPAREPVTDVPTPIRAYELPAARGGGRGDEGTIELDADVVVVGSGAGGGLVARDLARAGRSVVVLEAGPLLTEPDLPTDELAAFDRLYLDRGLTATWDGGISILAGRGVGGGTLVNWSTVVPPTQAIRAEWASRHGLEGIDGAAADRELAQLEAELGTAPPPNVPPKDALILHGAAALGVEADTTRRNAADCGDCGSCVFGCRRGSKRSTLRVQLAEARACGARIVPDATVRRVLIAREQVQGVEAEIAGPDGAAIAGPDGAAIAGPDGAAIAGPDGAVRLRVRAPQVVVAAGALRTPGVLARSGVVHPALGRFLRLHPVAVVAALCDDRIEMWRGTMQAARSFAWAPGSEAARSAGHAGFTIESAPGHPGLIAFALPWQGRARFAALMAQAAHVAPLIAITRDADWGTIRQTAGGRDRIEYPIAEATARTLRAGVLAAADLLRAGDPGALLAPGEPATAWAPRGGDSIAGAERDWNAFRRRLERLDFAPSRTLVFSAHQMGSARMGDVPSLHPVDPHGHVRWGPAGIGGDRTIRGLYVADASLFPTAIGVNPMLTVMLLATRVARTVIADGSVA